MKLVNFHVTEFQSVRDSNPIKVDDITCLVGKNEAGKTAVLQALYRLNPALAQDGKFDVTDDYPRSDVKDYLDAVASKKRIPATVVAGDIVNCCGRRKWTCLRSSVFLGVSGYHPVRDRSL